MIPAKPGIYLSNGKYFQTKNLQKKAKKLKDFQVIEILETDDCAELDQALNKYNKASIKEDREQKIILHHYINKDTGYSITSIYDNLKEEGFTQID
jgi:hypothetical protein